RLLALPHRWRDEAVRAGGDITRIALAFEPGRGNAAEIGREIEFLTVNPVLGPTRRGVLSRSVFRRLVRPRPNLLLEEHARRLSQVDAAGTTNTDLISC